MEPTNEYILSVSIAYYGNSQMFTGHGHAFDRDTVACIMFSPPINYQETVKELKELIREDIFLSEWRVVNGTEKLVQQLNDTFSEQAIRDAINKAFASAKDEDYCFSKETRREHPIRKVHDDSESDQLFGWIHILKR